MPLLSLGPQDGLYYEHQAATAGEGVTFVFVNPVAGDASQWQAAMASALRSLDHGTIVWSFRGQPNSMVVPEAGHMLPFEKPAAFVRALTEFADAIAASAR